MRNPKSMRDIVVPVEARIAQFSKGEKDLEFNWRVETIEINPELDASIFDGRAVTLPPGTRLIDEFVRPPRRGRAPNPSS